MFNLFRRSKARPATAPKARLGLEALDQRDCPSSLVGDDLRCGNELPIPPLGGCWPGPSPFHDAAAVIGSADIQTQKVGDAASIVVIGSNPVTQKVGDAASIVVIGSNPVTQKVVGGPAVH